MSFKVVNTYVIPDLTFGEELLEPLKASLVNGVWVTEDDLIANAKDADGILCMGPIQSWSPRVLAALSKCRIIATLSIGFDRIPLQTAAEKNIAVTNIPDYCIDEVSNQSIAFMMALGRRLFPIDRAVRGKQPYLSPANRRELKDFAYPVFRMRGQTLGIIGLGKIGTTVALKARGLGLRVIAYDPYVLGAVMMSRGVEPVDLDTLLRESDYVSINAALTDETRNLINPDAFRKMKPTCYLINTARGGIVQQSALLEALEKGLIAGAGLDVTADEPIKAGNPILKFPNVILTGHSAWYSEAADSNAEYWHKAMTQVVSALKGEWPIYAVNPEIKSKWVERWGKKV